ncbi:MAG: hypothetical protein ACK53Y_20810, partial [bacterium]
MLPNDSGNCANNNSNKRQQGAAAESAGDYMNRGSSSYISQVRSGKRYVTTARTIASIHNNSNHIEAKAKLDSHADTTVAGSTCRVLELTEKSCDVYPFSNSYDPISQVPIAKVATAYDDPVTGETLILVFGQALYLG